VAGKVHITGPGTAVISASDGSSSIPQNLTVIASVTPTIAISPVSQDNCQDSLTTYTATITNGGTSPVYQWEVNGVNTGTNSTQFTSSSLNNADQVTCTLTSNATCTTSATAASNTATFTIDPPVTTSLSIASSAPGPVCPGTPVTFIASAVTPDNNPTFQWLVNGKNTGAGSPVFVSTSLGNGDVVTCNMISTGKCLVNPDTVSNAVTVSISPADVCTIIIPNTFTPNGDGINDRWDITALVSYPYCSVNIYTRYGTLIYSSIGYPKPWDGTYNGKPLPVGTYYYLIDPKNGMKKLAGFVTILR
jgi:gliding motility-associated-like protein